MSAHAVRPVAVLLSPVLPRPGGSGRALRAWDWLAELAATHEVHVWSAEPADGLLPGWPDGARLWHAAGDLRPVSAWLRRLGWLCPALCAVWPRAAVAWHGVAAQPPALAAMAAQIGQRPVARLVVFRLYLDEVAGWVRGRLQVGQAELDMDDLDSAALASAAGSLWRVGRRLQAVLCTQEARQFRGLERRVPGGYDRVWLAAPEDLAAGAARAAVRPNRLRQPAPVQADAGKTGTALLFVGSLDHPPNEEAALFLAEQLAPVLGGRLHGPWSLTVAGRRPSARLRARLARCARVQLVADAADLSALYASASIAVLPLFAGGGTKFKTLEALAHGLAVVATGEAVRGLDLHDGVHFLRAETLEQFVHAVARLHDAPDLRRRLAAAAREWSQRHMAGARPAHGATLVEGT
ncbi:glycosyltransferase [Pseudorhodoferax sp.]|uniref:glycosyltransferase n=1 Tax=Pseudorhodoferax sp. TaxID=1993553 RepID=UPI002DD64410|nr:glycosyltransferase [Pseudorhodoferax sp.]